MFYFPTSRPELLKWLQNFKSQIGVIGPKMQEPADIIAKYQADIDKLIASIEQAEQAKQEWQRLLAITRNTDETVGVELRNYVKHLKTSPFYTDETGRLLQVISTTAIVDLTDYQPVLVVKVTGGLVQISFRKHGADGMNIYTRLEGETTWKLLANAKVSPFVDQRPLADHTKPEVREYYAMATLQNVEVGVRSEIVSIKYTV